MTGMILNSRHFFNCFILQKLKKKKEKSVFTFSREVAPSTVLYDAICIEPLRRDKATFLDHLGTVHYALQRL